MKKSIFLLFFAFSVLYAQEDKYYENIMLFSNVINHIKTNYIDEKDPAELIKSAIDGILQQLDPHTKYFSGEDVEKFMAISEGKAFETGIEFEIIGGFPVVISLVTGSPASESIVKSGHVIRLIDSIPVRNKSVPDIKLLLAGAENSSVNLTLYDADSIEYNVILSRKKLPEISVTITEYLDPGIGYIKIDQFILTTAKEFETAYKKLKKKGMKKLIMDLRDNPGGIGVSAVDVSDFFLEEGKVIFKQKSRKEDLNHEFIAKDNDLSTEIPIIVLMNRGSASASEIVAGALQDNDRALIIGTNSFGKGLGLNYFYLKTGGLLIMTCLRGETPAGRSVQRIYKDKDYYEYRNEIFNTDSINYKNLPTIKTIGGRTIYTGSGILPDIFIDDRISTPIKGWTNVLKNNNYKRFCENYFKTNEQMFNKIEDIQLYSKKYEIDDSVLKAFKTELEKKDIKISMDNPDNLNFIKKSLKSEFAKLKWDKSQYLLYNLFSDTLVMKAINSFDNIDELLKINKN